MNTARSTLTVIILAAATTLILGTCAAFKPQDPVASQNAVTPVPPPPTSTDTVPMMPRYHPGEILPVPLFSVPAIGMFASNADKTIIQTTSSSFQSVPGVTVSSAKCDGNILIPGSTVSGSGDSASTSTGNGVITNNGNDADLIVEDPIIITYDGDDSGSYVNSGTHVPPFILSDSGGAYSAESVSVLIDSRGYGNYSNSGTDESIVNSSNGPGNYSAGKTLIYNNRDGSGSYSDGTLSIINCGDGMALVDGVAITDASRIEPLPALGKLPPVESSKPVESYGTTIVLKDGVLFDFGKSDIRSDAVHTLFRLATVLNDAKIPAAHIYGHTDSISDETFNLQSLQKRADTVSIKLKKGGMSAILDAAGYGRSKPVVPNGSTDGSDNPTGRALNRCVEISIPAFQHSD